MNHKASGEVFSDHHKVSIVKGDALDLIKEVPDESVHMVLTDPPYFLDGMGDNWDHNKISSKARRGKVVKKLPVGMKFDRSQGTKLGEFMRRICPDLYKVLKPGGFFVCFSQARLYHCLAAAVEDCGFEIRDMLGWKYEGQAKAFSMDHFIRKRTDLNESEKEKLIEETGGRKTPQLKPQIEPMVLAQKPRKGTFVENWLKYSTGLVDTTASLDGTFPGNIMEVKKPSVKEKGKYNCHFTVKPGRLIDHLLRLFSKEGQVILDPFIGSGTTAVSSVRLHRKCIGFEKEDKYYNITLDKIREAGYEI